LNYQEFLSPPVQDFIRSIEHEDPGTIVLKKKTIGDFPSVFLAEQVAGRKKAREKLPLFHKTPGIVFPPPVNLEQCSSEATAQFKTGFVQRMGLAHLDRFADLTGGFGVDGFFFSTLFKNGDMVEPNLALLEIARHNHHQLGAASLQYHNTTAEEFLKNSGAFDLIYIDPSRRAAGNQKVYSLMQSEPNVVALQSEIFGKTSHLLIKTSPLLDIQIALKELKNVKRVAVLSVENECKELLFFCEKNFIGEPVIEAVNIISQQRTDTFEFQFQDERITISAWSDPLAYIYEPNASILKAGAFRLLGTRYGLYKLQVNTHLYTSDKLVENFPGRVFKVVSLVKPDPKSLKEFFPEGKANVMTRNYPTSVAELKKKTKLEDGGERYLIGFSGKVKKLLVVAERVF
jgi:16S rRNA G966 N2-methylase RsmD